MLRLPLTHRLTQLGNQANRLWAISDQALFAVANLFMTLAFARVLSQSDYGLFTLTQSLFLLVAALHTSLLTEPMLVFCSKQYSSRVPEYMGALVCLHAVLSVALLALLATVVLLNYVLSGAPFGSLSCLGLALVSPLTLLQWMLRRASFAVLQPRKAATAGLIYCLTSGILIYGSFFLTKPTLLSAFVVQAVSPIPSCYWLFRNIDIKTSRTSLTLIRSVWATHAGYAKWASPYSVMKWIPANGVQWILAGYVGANAAASLRALIIPYLPFTQTAGALSILLIPTFVRASAHGALHNSVKRNLGLLVLTACCFAGMLCIFRVQIMHILYKGRYDAVSFLLPLIGLVAIPDSIMYVITSYFQAIARPKQVFLAYSVSSIATVTFGVGFVFSLGLQGSVIAFLLTYVATALFLAILYVRQQRIYLNEIEPRHYGGLPQATSEHTTLRGIQTSPLMQALPDIGAVGLP